jgi:hypothetical protein
MNTIMQIARGALGPILGPLAVYTVLVAAVCTGILFTLHITESIMSDIGMFLYGLFTNRTVDLFGAFVILIVVIYKILEKTGGKK